MNTTLEKLKSCFTFNYCDHGHDGYDMDWDAIVDIYLDIHPNANTDNQVRLSQDVEDWLTAYLFNNHVIENWDTDVNTMRFVEWR